MADIQTLADTALRSGVMGISNSSQAVMKILAGHEMGLGAFASLSNIHIIQEKPVLSAGLIAAMIKASPKYNYQIKTFTNQTCEIVFFEKINGNWAESGESSYTMEDAAAAELLDKKNKDGSKNNWQKYPRNMLFARAISNGARWYCPDIFAGSTVYTPDELDAAVDAEGNLIEGSWQHPADPDQDGISVNDLIARYGAAAVMEANGGQVPSDDPGSLAALREKLETEYTPV
jgi:hypothetical protein